MQHGMAARGPDVTSSRRAEGAGWGLFFAAAGLLLISANLFAAAYVSSERYIYTWDWSLYWGKFGLLGSLLRSDFFSALAYVGWSVGNEDYTVLPLLPLVPVEFVFGAERLSYILAITNLALLPSAALMAWVAERTQQRRSWARFLLCTLAVLCLHVLWAPALRGLPDVLGVAISAAVLLVYFGKPLNERTLLELVGFGLLISVLVLTRRWYLFWAVSFFPAAIIAYALGSPKERMNWKSLWATARGLAIAGVACGVCLLVLAAPLLIRMAETDYATAYAAYRPELGGGGAVGQVIAQFGIAVLAVCAAGLLWLAIKPETRQLGVLLIVQAALSLALFERVQGLLGVQHFYLLVPAAGIGIAAAIIGLWNSVLQLHWRASAIAAVLAMILLSSAAALTPVRLSASPWLPRNHYPPLVRPDLAEVDRLMDVLQALKPERVYVVSSSEVLNWDTLRTACRVRHRQLCPHLAITADIDARDGFPRDVLKADTVVLATPTQYHVRPADQQVVGLLARDIRERRGIGSSFEPLPGKFLFWRRVDVQVYRRTKPLREQDVKALSDEFVRSYPTLRGRFEL